LNNFRKLIKEILKAKDKRKKIKKNIEEEKTVKENIYNNSSIFNNRNTYTNISDNPNLSDLSVSKNSLKKCKNKDEKKEKYSDYELNNILYYKAIEIDKRT
jgi:hypothetical protein